MVHFFPSLLREQKCVGSTFPKFLFAVKVCRFGAYNYYTCSFLVNNFITESLFFPLVLYFFFAHFSLRFLVINPRSQFHPGMIRYS